MMKKKKIEMNRKRKMKMTTTMLLLLLPLLFFQLREPIELPNILASGAGGGGDKQSFAVALVENAILWNILKLFRGTCMVLRCYFMPVWVLLVMVFSAIFDIVVAFSKPPRELQNALVFRPFLAPTCSVGPSSRPAQSAPVWIPKTYLYFNKTWALAIFSAPFKKKSN